MNSHNFNKKAWSAMDMFNQMGNIGSEVCRTLKAKRLGQTDRMQSAFARGLDLIDYTAQLWAREKLPCLRELLITREQFAESVVTDNLDVSLEAYFMQFATAARLRR